MFAAPSAFAIREQRSKWEASRLDQLRREGRESVVTLPLPQNCIISRDGRVYFDEERRGKGLFGHVTMMYTAGVLMLLGGMLVVAALLPSHYFTSLTNNKNEVLGTGCAFFGIGGILAAVSRFLSNDEENDLNEYIKARLARSKSDSRYVHNSGAICMSTRERPSFSVQSANSAGVRANVHTDRTEEEAITIDSNCDQVIGRVDSPDHVSSTEPLLSRISETTETEVDTDATPKTIDSTPVTPTPHCTLWSC